MSNQNGYIGRSPGDSAVIIASQTFEPTGIQTDFTFASGYTVGYLDVYFNGARLVYANDYTASNGTTVGLTTYANNGDVLELVAYKAFNVGDVTEAKNNFTVGDKLTVSGVTTATSAYYTGSVTASSFSGDGSALTGMASTDNIITSTASTFTGGVNISGASNINISGATTITGAAGAYLLNVSGITTVGILTVYDTTQSTSASTGGLVIHGGVGIAKSLFVDGNVTIGGTLTYEDMTNTDNLGFGTFRKGIEVQGAGSTTTTLNVTGVSTLTGQANIGSGVTINSTGIEVTSGIITAGTCFKAGGGSFGPGIGATILGSGNAVFAGIVTAATTLKVGVGATIHGSSGNAVFAGIVTATTLKYGTTSVETAIDAKASTGKAIAMAMVFGF